MIQAAKIIGTGLATTGLIGAGIGIDESFFWANMSIHWIIWGIILIVVLISGYLIAHFSARCGYTCDHAIGSACNCKGNPCDFRRVDLLGGDTCCMCNGVMSENTPALMCYTCDCRKYVRCPSRVFRGFSRKKKISIILIDVI